MHNLPALAIPAVADSYLSQRHRILKHAEAAISDCPRHTHHQTLILERNVIQLLTELELCHTGDSIAEEIPAWCIEQLIIHHLRTLDRILHS